MLRPRLRWLVCSMFAAALVSAGGAEAEAAATPQTGFASYQIAPTNQPTVVLSLATAPDGSVWFTSGSQSVNLFGRITAQGSVTMIPMPSSWHLEAPCRCIGGFERMIAGGGSLWVSALHDGHGWVGRWSTAGKLLAEYKLPTAGSAALAWGPDGNVWFSGSVNNCAGGLCSSGGYIGRLTPKGSITQFPIPDPSNRVADMTAGPDGALWFTEEPGTHVGRITTQGAIAEFTVPGVPGNIEPQSGDQNNITAGPDGALWATLYPVGIVRIALDGSTRSFATPQDVAGCCAPPNSITAGPLGSLWFTSSLQDQLRIGRLSTSGTIVIYAVPASVATYLASVIAGGPDGAVWFGEQNTIVRLAPTVAPTAPSTGASLSAVGGVLILVGIVALLLLAAVRPATRP